MYSLPDLPYDYNALEPYIDEQTMSIHHDLHHGGYVKNLNDALANHSDLLQMNIEDLMSDLNRVPKDIRTKIRNNGGGHYNHSLFWTCMSPQGGGNPTGNLAEAIITSFGSIKLFKKKFTQAGLGRFGSGWAWLVLNGVKLSITDTQNQDTPLMEEKIPLLGIDVWEHAYYLKYRNRRAEYIKAWWNVVNWSEIQNRFQHAMK